MNFKKYIDRISEQRGNAILFSMIIMTAAMTISLGMASLVAGEVRSVGLVLPAERAYYKAESYVEQGLWQKKQDSNYQVTNKSQLANNFLCNTAPCFTTAPTDQATLLKEFLATASPDEDILSFPADESQQYDVVTTGATGSGTIRLSDLKGQTGYRGLEVTIIAYSKAANPSAQFPVDDPLTAAVEQPTTAVFVDKEIIPAGETSRNIQVGTGQTNPVGESYPPLDANTTYRLRIKALGSDATAKVSVESAGGTELTLNSADFTVRAVAEDGKSRRGIQVKVPSSEQPNSIFDFVLFSDLDLHKLQGKLPAKSIVATVYQVAGSNCSGTSTPVVGGQVTLSQNGNNQTKNTNDVGSVSFSGLTRGATYTVNTALPSGLIICTPPGNNQSTTFSNDNTTEIRQMTFRVRFPQRVPWYRLNNSAITDHFFTADYNEFIYWATHGYAYEGVAGYLYNVQVPGTAPLYRSWNQAATTHYYTMSLAAHNYWNANGYVSEGITGYIAPYTGSCPAGTSPLYEGWWPGGDHLYTMSSYEGSAAYLNLLGWQAIGITGCMWTGP